MEEIAKAKRAEFDKNLAKCEHDIQTAEYQLGQLRASREQLKGAIEGIDQIFRASKNAKPDLKLVPQEAAPIAVAETTQLPPENA